MEVSIIIPVYNAEKYVARCLDSLFQQTVQDFEIICIDDCGTDDSKSILYEYQQKYPDQLIILENKKNCGAGQSREHGIAQASGTYLVFVDSDDYLAPDYLKTYLEAMKKHPCDIMIGGFIKDRGGRLENHAVSDSVWSVVTSYDLREDVEEGLHYQERYSFRHYFLRRRHLLQPYSVYP